MVNAKRLAAVHLLLAYGAQFNDVEAAWLNIMGMKTFTTDSAPCSPWSLTIYLAGPMLCLCLLHWASSMPEHIGTPGCLPPQLNPYLKVARYLAAPPCSVLNLFKRHPSFGIHALSLAWALTYPGTDVPKITPNVPYITPKCFPYHAECSLNHTQLFGIHALSLAWALTYPGTNVP
jgi:hypothetical protein